MAIVAFVFGLVVMCISLFSHFVVIAILPLLFGVRGIIETRRTGRRGLVLAILGIVFAAISAILYILGLIAQ